MRTITTLCCFLLLTVAPAFAQAPAAGKVYRVGMVASGSLTTPVAAFRETLAVQGYVEGRNLVIERRDWEGRPERLPDVIGELLRADVDVLVIGSTTPVLAAMRATRSVPIVFASLFDPVGSGIVNSLARPGGNVTGSSIGVGGAGLGGKWIEVLREAVPGIKRVAVLANSTNPANGASVRELEAAARALNMKVDLHDAPTAAALDRALASIATSGAQGIVVTNDPFFTVNRDKLAQFAMSRRLPSIYFFEVFADAGGLLVYAASLEESYRKAALYVDKIFRGAKPADLPVQQPTKFDLVINLKTAKTMGVTIPPSLLARATRVIE